MNKRLYKILILVTVLLISLTGCKNKDVTPVNPYKSDEDIMRYTIDTLPYYDALEDLIYYSGWDIEDVDKVIEKHRDLLTDNFINQYRAMANNVVYDDTIDPPDTWMEDYGEEYVEDFEYQNTFDDNSSNIDEPGTGSYDESYNADDEDWENELGTGSYDESYNADDEDYNEDELGIGSYDDSYDADEEMSLNMTPFNLIIAYALEDTNNLFEDEYSNFEFEEEYYEEEYYDEEATDYVDTPVYDVISIDAYQNKLVASVVYKYGSNMKVIVDLVDNKIDGYTIYR